MFFRVLLIVLLMILTGCSRNPVTGENSLNFYSDASEKQIGEENHTQILDQYGEYPDENLRKYIQTIVTKLGDVSHRPDLEYKVTVLNTPMVNAMALPGGHVYVCRGILKYFNSESELAGVMAHEIGHVAAKHGVEQLSKATALDFGLLFGSWIFFKDDQAKAKSFLNIGSSLSALTQLSYSRENEMQADRLGIEYTQKAGYSPLGVGRVMVMFERMQNNQASNPLLTVLSTHPASEIRAKQARIEIRKLEDAGQINTNLDRDKYLDVINGTIVGYDPARGTINDNVYYNTKLFLKILTQLDYTQYLELPGYLFALQSKDKNRTIYYAFLDSKDAVESVRVQQMEKQTKTPAKSVLSRSWENNSGNAYYYLIQNADGTYLQVSHYLSRYQNGLLEILCIEKQKYPDLNIQPLDQVLADIHILSAQEAQTIQPEYLRVIASAPTDTWQSLTTKYFGGEDPKRLAWLNDCELSDPLPARIKLGLF